MGENTTPPSLIPGWVEWWDALASGWIRLGGSAIYQVLRAPVEDLGKGANHGAFHLGHGHG